MTLPLLLTGMLSATLVLLSSICGGAGGDGADDAGGSGRVGYILVKSRAKPEIDIV